MSRRKTLPAIIVLAAIGILLVASSALASGTLRWTSAGVPVASRPYLDEFAPATCSDGSGGVIVAWYTDVDSDLFVQRLNSAGSPQWTAGGVQVADNVTSPDLRPAIVSDGSNGAIVLWLQTDTKDVIKGHHVMANGSLDTNWAAGMGGKTVVESGGVQNITQFKACSDGSNGAIVAYCIFEAGGNQLMYGWRLSGTDGGALWSAGTPVKTGIANEDQEMPTVACDGTGGAVISFSANGGGGGSPRAFAQRFDSSGAAQWVAAPTYPLGALPVTDNLFSYNCAITNLDATNFVIAYTDSSTDLMNDRMYIQKVATDGSRPWGGTGVSVKSSNNNNAPSLVCSGGTTYIAWEASDVGVFAQKVSSTGVPAWTTGGVLLSDTIAQTFESPPPRPVVTTDGFGGMICAWADMRDEVGGTAHPHIYVQRLDSSGAGHWAATGMAACSFDAEWQEDACIVSDDSKGTIVVWKDQRAGSQMDVYAQRLSNSAPTFTSCSPNSSLNIGTLTMTINGANFMPGVHAKFRMHGSPSYVAATSSTYISPTKMTAVFDVDDIEPSTYDVGVYNSDDQGAWGNSVLTIGMLPNITGATPNSTYPGGPAVTVTGIGFGDTPGTVSFNGVPATNITSWADRTIVAVPPEGSSTGPLTVTSEWGTGNAVQITMTAPEQNMAEGTNAWGFETKTALLSPVPGIYLTPDIETLTLEGNQLYEIPPGYFAPLSVMDLSDNTLSSLPDVTPEFLNSFNGDFSMQVSTVEDLGGAGRALGAEQASSIFADRTMKWTGTDAASPEIHSSVGATTSSNKWYMPEGTANWGFETWILVQNPGKTKANVDLKYMIEGEGPKVVKHEVPAGTRATFNLEQDIGKKDASIQVISDKGVIAERAVYKNNRRLGTDSIGASRPSEDYYLAEGSTAWGFTTYVLVQNPNDEPCDVVLTFMTENGGKTAPKYRMSGNSRKTFRINDFSPDKGCPIDVSNCDFSTKVHGSKPIVAERAMYWGAGTAKGEAGHDSIGTPLAHKNWYLADGEDSDDNGRTETFTLVQNPNSSEIEVEISYLTPGAKNNKVFTEKIKANSRKTFNMGDKLKGRSGVMVKCKTSGKKIIVERAMYINQRGGGSDTIGSFTD